MILGAAAFLGGYLLAGALFIGAGLLLGRGRLESLGELLANSGLEAAYLDQLIEFGMIRFRPGTKYFDADALTVAATVAELAEYGLEPRHIRAFKTAADREIGLIDQIVSPMARQRDESAKARADEVVRELGALSVRLHATLVKIGLRGSR